MTAMIENLGRPARLQGVKKPQFFAGQIIDFRDFNRLVQHSDNSVALLCQIIFPQGGIFSGVASELRAEVLDGLKIRILPGVAVLPNGKFCVVQEDLLIDLSTICLAKPDALVRVGIRATEKGEDYYVDPEDPAIFGYKSGIFNPETVITLDHELINAVELFRIRLNQGDQEATNVDSNYRKMIVVHGAFPGGVESAIDWRKELQRLEQILSKFRQIFLVEDTFQTEVFITLLHYELLNRPFQEERASFLLEEVSKRLRLFLERLIRERSGNHPNFDRESILRSIQKVEQVEVKNRILGTFKIDQLIEAINNLADFIQNTENGYDFLARIRNALHELAHRNFKYDDKITLFGHTFERISWIQPKDEDCIKLDSPASHMRSVNAKYSNGDSCVLPGIFIKEGTIEVKINLRKTDRPLVLLFQHYLRRSETEIQFEWNGKLLSNDQFGGADYSNVWINRGIVLPAEYLVKDENRLKIQLSMANHDFGFFGVVAYQPLTTYLGSVV